MKISEEFNVKSASGQMVTLQTIVAGKTYLDYGYNKLPANFTGYRIKDTNGTAEKQSDGSFQLSTGPGSYQRV